MDMEKGHMSIRREVSWSPGGLRKPLQATKDMHAPSTECNASWEMKGIKGEQMGRKTNLTRSASLSEKELKEARVRSQIIAAQLTIPSNSNSRGVQLFNRRKQRVNAFTIESCGERPGEDRGENEKADPSNKLTWAERSSEEKHRELNCKNSATKSLLSPIGRVHSVGDIMEEPGEHCHEVEDIENSVIQERHFLPVKEQEEQDKVVRDEVLGEVEEKVKDEIPPGSDNACPAGLEQAEGEGGINGVYSEPVSAGKIPNGCHSTSGPERISVSTSKQATTIINRTARPFFSPTTVQSPEPVSPVMDIPPAPSYSTPPLPTFTTSHPVAFSPPPPPPSYPTPPLPAFTNQPPQTFSSPPPMSPVMSPTSPPVSQFPHVVSPVSHYVPANPPMAHCGPPTAPRPTTFIPQPTEAKKVVPIKTGILEEGAARRASRKSMFTFKEKPVVAPNPELLSLVQGVDEKKKHVHRSVPEPVSEEELLALGAEASNFMTKDEEGTEAATATVPEWASCLKSSRTRARVEHRPEQTLTNASGKGAELFAKRQSRMEKYMVENQNAGQMRSPSPTMSLPPSWVYPSNMPGRVKAIAKNSDMSAQLSQNIKAQQAVKRKPSQKAPPPQPAPEPAPPLENGCSKIEMDLSRHRPYQLSSSLFILNPVKDPMSSLPRGAPRTKPTIPSQSYSRQTSLPSTPIHFSSHVSHRSALSMSPQLPVSPAGGTEYPANPMGSGQPRITSPMSAISPDRVSSPRTGIQAPKPTFSAKKAGIEPQTKKESSPDTTPSETPTPTRTPNLTRRFSSPQCATTGTWSTSLQTNQLSSNISISKPSVVSPMSPPWGSRCQSPMVSQNTQTSTANSTSRPSQTPTATCPVSPPWGSRCQSPIATQNAQPSWVSNSSARRSQTPTATSPVSPPWGSRCQSPIVSQTSCSSPATKPLYTSSATSPVSPPRESRCMSPIVSNLDSKANHRLLAKNIINAAKRKNSPSPGTVSSHSLPISPLSNSHHGYDCNKPSISPFQTRALGAQSPTFTSPPPTPTQRICSPVRLYNTRSLTDSDASVESEDSGLRSPGLHAYNTCPRGWGGSLRVKRGNVATDL
ncbi:mucin-2 [Myripristis murdjan]|uniref:mucin-2 n=1 Tax=Myripristis murdjan TaxID=586833 RepID=UPI001175FEA0|nr:synaptopodin [Myripristis murdjan]